MNHLIDSRWVAHGILAPATVLAIILSTAQAVFAIPMRCSGEETICINSCKKNPDRSTLSICVTNCGIRMSICRKTSCWDTGAQRYCGLLKQ